MSFKQLLLACTTFLLLSATVPQAASAQWSIGASYEVRNEVPENGFGVRIERNLLETAPVANLSLRAHFSYFNENNALSADGANISADITSYDYGLAAVGGFSMGLLSPYLGLGIGSTTLELSNEDAAFPGEGSENSLFWNGFIGAKVSPIPFLKPFVEYRLQSAQEFEDLGENVDTSNGRLIFGLYIAF